MLDLSLLARVEWVGFHDEVEYELGARGKFRGMRDVAAKAAESVARLAALFHALEHGAAGTIRAKEIAAAGRIVAWHLTERGRARMEEDGRWRAVAINPALLDGRE